jgi:glucose/mannose transport system substrate-binding protein
MRRARNLGAALLVGSALTIVACGGSDSSSGGQSAAKGNALEIFSWWTSGSEDAALKELISSFKAADRGAKVSNGAVAGGGGGNAQAVLQTRLQGNNAPDTWQTHPGPAIGQYVDAGYVTDITSVFNQDKLGDVMPKALVDAQSKDGKVYGVATGAHRGNVLWFNKKLLAKAGVAEPRPGYTLDQFTSDLAKLDSNGITGICLGAKDPFAAPQLFENTFLGVAGPERWNAITSGKSPWDSPEVSAAAGQFAKILPYVDPDASASTWDQATKKLASGDCAFESMGDWAYGELNKSGVKEGKDFGYVPHPGTDGSFVMVVDTFVVAQNAKHPEEAKQWISAIMSKDAQLAFNKEKGSTPVRTDVDVSSLPTYQQQAAKDFRDDSLVWSIAHGEATSPQFQQSFYDAVAQFMQSKETDSFVQALAAGGA